MDSEGSGIGDFGGRGELSRSLREHSAAVMRYTASLAKRMGLEVSEVAALEHVQAEGRMTLGELRDRLSMSAGAVTTLVDRLEKRGYLRRIPNPDDRRSSLVEVTKEGLDETLRHLWAFVEDMMRVEDTFTRAERDAIRRYLDASIKTTNEHSAIRD